MINVNDDFDFNCKGELLNRLGKPLEAAEMFNAAISAEPDFLEYRENKKGGTACETR